MWNSEGYVSKRTSWACTAEHPWDPRFALFTTIWGRSSSTWYTTKTWPMEALVLYTDISYWQQEIFKAFWEHSDLRWLWTLPGRSQVLARKFKIFLSGKALKKCLSGEVFHLLYNMASAPLLLFFFFFFFLMWLDNMASDPFQSCHFGEMVHSSQNGGQRLLLQSC